VNNRHILHKVSLFAIFSDHVAEIYSISFAVAEEINNEKTSSVNKPSTEAVPSVPAAAPSADFVSGKFHTYYVCLTWANTNRFEYDRQDSNNTNFTR
jgi:hypothetical protein